MFYRSAVILSGINVLILLLALGAMVLIAWTSAQRLELAHGHFRVFLALEEAQMALDRALEQPGTAAAEAEGLVEVVGLLNEARASDAFLDPGTATALEAVDEDLSSGRPRRLEAALARLDEAVQTENEARLTMIGRLHGYLAQAWQVAVVLAGALAAAMLVLSVLLFRRVIRPLGQLSRLMAVIARRDYAPAPTRGVDPILRPVFHRYNAMVAQLAAIDEDHHERQDQLEGRIRAASHALLQQQVELARSQRLAAAGEVAASLAHEIRNPLASMQMALGNLRADLTDREHVERLDLVLGELRRVARLLADVLDHARQPPEPVAHLALREVVDSLVGLTRYQVPEQLRLIVDIPEDLRCDLPEAALRRSLLNLVLNAAQAIGGQEGEIRIAAELCEGALAVSVCDTGPGFPELLLRTGVRPYDTRRAGGTGLGLATVRRFVRDQHGEIRLANRHPNGACVRLYLPQNGSDHVQVAADH